MFSFLQQRQLNKAFQAIQQGDLDRVAKFLKQTEVDTLNQPIFNHQTACEVAIYAQQDKSLNLLLSAGADPNGTSQEGIPLLFLTLSMEKSLSLMSELLKAGAWVNQPHPIHQEPVLISCIKQCSSEHRMLHINRLQQYGASLDVKDEDGRSAFDYALVTQDRSLLSFLIQSGVEPPTEWPTDLPEDLQTYLKRCVDDLRIRKMFLGK